jgi:hypothetical protein
VLGCGSLPGGEWVHANGYKQNQVKGASKKVGFNHAVHTLFHFDRAPAKQTAFYWQRVKRQDFLADGNRAGDRTVSMETKTAVVLASHLTRES